MIADEIDGPGPAKAKSRVVDQLTDNCVYLGLCMAIAVAMASVSIWLDRLGFRCKSFPIMPVLVGLSPAIAQILSNAILRRVGLGPPGCLVGTRVELWTQRQGDAAGVDLGAVVEARQPASLPMGEAKACFIVFFPLFVLTGGLLMLMIVPAAQGQFDPTTVCLMIGLVIATVAAGLGGAWYRHEGLADAPRYRLDAAGIAGPHGRPTIPWATVASYRVTTNDDNLGRSWTADRDLLGRDGKPLLTFHLDDLIPADRDRLLIALADRFPTPIKTALEV